MNKSGVASQVITHPQGGGAIKGLGETFAPNLHMGTGNLTVPIAVPPGRHQLQPNLALEYSTGNGNGPFGFGWALSLPRVSRDTSKGLPGYVDEQDAFVLSGGEQLVPVRSTPDGVTVYRPRTEGLFARITHRVSATDDYWQVSTRDGLTSTYAQPGARGADAATLRDPDDASRVFAWNLTQTLDPFGNRIDYIYARDPSTSSGPARWDQLYLTTIRYADYGAKDAPQFLVTVDFLYEDRPDPFSSRRAGFDIRTTRRCSQIRMSTHATAPQLAKIYRLSYDGPEDAAPLPGNGVSLLRQIQVEGINGELREPLPALEFSYTRFDPTQRVYQPIAAVGNAMPERSLAHPDFELADLFGRGLPDVVQIGETNRYWKNLGNGRLDVPRVLDGLPPGVHLGDRGTQLADLDGDGQIDLLVSSNRGISGYLPLTATPGGARSFVAYAATVPVPLDDPQLKLVDLDGDGVTDALRTAAQFELYFNDRSLGWNRVERRARGDVDRFPNVEFGDARVKLADMTGDGLQDIVFVNAGCIDYWPYLGNGRWGERITMRGRLDFPDAAAFGGVGFDPKRLLLGDVDGDGVADLVYVESGSVTLWLNQSGNAWSSPIRIHGTPPLSEPDAVRLVDLLGHGTAGLLWTYDARSFADSTYKFLDLAGGIKPYLLNERDNHAGARTLVDYAPSTQFSLEDERQPRTRWRSRLPFPVQVVARVETIDELSGGKLTTTFRYHSGYWDGDEREFRGFGLVEQFDSETFASYSGPGLHGDQPFGAVPDGHFSPPTLTRLWFHQGQVQDSEGVWSESGLAMPGGAGDPALFAPTQRVQLARIARSAALAADPVRIRHALRCLRGSLLRSELYALDAAPNRSRPYTVTEALFDVREIEGDDPGAANRLGIFFPAQVATRTTQWERGVDPMTHVTFTGGHDQYGLPHTQLEVAVPRGRNPSLTTTATVEPYLSTATVTDYARRDDAQRYLVDRVARIAQFDVVNDGRQSVFALSDAVASGAAQLQVIAHQRSFYDGDAFVGLPLGQVGDYGALVREESLAFTDDFLSRTFDQSDPLSVSRLPTYLTPNAAVAWTGDYPEEFRAALAPLAGYVHYGAVDVPGSPGGYFVTTRRHRYDVHDVAGAGRGLLRVTRDPLGGDTSIGYDEYDLLRVRVVDPVGLTTVAAYDYRVLQAQQITDPNGNVAAVEFSPLGFVTAESTRGAHGEGDGQHPSSRTEYDLLAFQDRRQPIFVRRIRRVHHDSESDLSADERDRTIESLEYSDGFGRLLQQRIQVEDTLFGDPVSGGNLLSADQSASVTASVGHTRQATDPVNVLVSGWQTYDNKGRVVEKYEPFFAQGWDFAAPSDAQRGQKASLFYDPRGQLTRTVAPDGSTQLVVVGVPSDLTNPASFTPTPWETYTYDANDNAGRSHPTESAAYSNHWNTPASITVDALGRTVSETARNGPNPATDWYQRRFAYDSRGNLLTVTDALGRVASRAVFDLAKRRWRLDSLDAGRRDTVPDALGGVVEARDSKGALSLRSFDLLHRPARVWARDGGAGPLTLRQRLEYGDGGRPDQAQDERATAQRSNLLGELVRQYDEAGLSTVAAVDFKGNVVDRSRRVIADAAILAVFDHAPASSWQVPAFQVDWQPDAQQTLAQRETALLELTAYQTTVAFDALDRATWMQLPQDVEGRRRILRPTYNSSGDLQRLLLDDTVYVEHIAYDARRQRTLVAYGNGVMTRATYHPQTFRLQRLRSERATRADATTYAPAGSVLQDYAYQHDLAGNVLSTQDRAPGSGILNNPAAAGATGAGDAALAKLLASGDALVRTFTYDPIYQLLSATGRECDAPPDGPPWTDVPRGTDLTRTRGCTESYRYDPVGNLLGIQHQNGTGGFTRSITVSAASNRPQSVQIGQASVAYTVDPNGNLQAETTSRHFDWNHADQLRAYRTGTEGAEPSVYAHYLYDAAGQRVKKLVRKQGGQVEATHYVDGVFEHQRWGGGTSAAASSRLHLMDDQRRIALVRVGPEPPGGVAPAVQYELADHLGSSNVVVDATGALVNREEFTAYGETSFGSFARKRYRFTGKERDEESALSYHQARYYAPWLGRWISPDPIGVDGGPHAYRYAANNPMRLVDPNGTSPGETYTKVKVKIAGGALMENPVKDTEGHEIGHVNIGQGSVKVDLTKQKVEANVGVLDVEVDPKISEHFSFVTTAKVAKVGIGVSRQGFHADASAYEAGVGLKTPIGKAQVKFGLAASAKFENGKVGVKLVAGIGFEVELDFGVIFAPISLPKLPVATAPEIALPSTEELATRSSSVAHDDPPPPPKPVVVHRRPRPVLVDSQAHGCQFGPESPDPRARKTAADRWR